MQDLVQDHRINLVDVHRMTDEALSLYGEELWAVLSAIRYGEDKVKLRELFNSATIFRNMNEEAANVVCHYVKDRRLIKLLRRKEIINEDGGVDMCKGIEGIYEDGVEEGIERGKEELIVNAMKAGSTAEEIALALKIDLTYVLSLKDETQIIDHHFKEEDDIYNKVD